MHLDFHKKCMIYFNVFRIFKLKLKEFKKPEKIYNIFLEIKMKSMRT